MAGASEILLPFLGALQAALSVLLTMGYGMAACYFGLLDQAAAKKFSKTSVTIFLPMLLTYNLGSELHAETIMRYVPILVWALIYNVVSIALGHVACRLFGFPRWAVPAITFNNTSSMPLLLVQSLTASGMFSSLTMSPEDTLSDAISRAKSYFLACAVVGNTLTFGLGPSELKGHEEDEVESNGKAQVEGDEEHTAFRATNGQSTSPGHDEEDAAPETDWTPLLSESRATALLHRVDRNSKSAFHDLPSPLQRFLRAVKSFLSPPFFGAVFGLVIGVVPPLHRLFFDPMQEGGWLKAWLSESIKNTGQLFVTLQVVIVGTKLTASLREAKEGQDTGKLPWSVVAAISFVRYILWPAISISIIWALAAHTSLLANDPMLWFTMMLMPCGPTAMKLIALADYAGAEEKQKMVISKFLALTYIISPLISLAVVGSLKAAEAAKASRGL